MNMYIQETLPKTVKKSRAAETLLQGLFEAKTEIPAAQVLEAASDAGISTGTLHRAKRKLEIKSVRAGNGWIWRKQRQVNEQLRERIRKTVQLLEQKQRDTLPDPAMAALKSELAELEQQAEFEQCTAGEVSRYTQMRIDQLRGIEAMAKTKE
jgi:uncharacterized membrane protein YccC